MKFEDLKIGDWVELEATLSVPQRPERVSGVIESLGKQLLSERQQKSFPLRDGNLQVQFSSGFRYSSASSRIVGWMAGPQSLASIQTQDPEVKPLEVVAEGGS